MNVTTSYSCNVTESELMMAHDLESGSSRLKFLDLFWEHGSYIFNATDNKDSELVGSWNYRNCILELNYYEEKILNSTIIDIVSKEDKKLKVRYRGYGEYAIFIKHVI